MIVGALMVGVMTALVATGVTLGLGYGLLTAVAVYMLTGTGALLLTLGLALRRSAPEAEPALVAHHT